jgi:hypothetical protein
MELSGRGVSSRARSNYLMKRIIYLQQKRISQQLPSQQFLPWLKFKFCIIFDEKIETEKVGL